MLNFSVLWAFETNYLPPHKYLFQKGGGCGGEAVSFGQVPARYLQLHLHQEDSVMVGEDLVYSLTVTLL